MNWIAIIKEDETLFEDVKQKLAEIKVVLNNYKYDDAPIESLFGGKLGTALFFLYYYKFSKNIQDKLTAQKIIEEVFDKINKNSEVLFSFSSGISGIAWLIQFSENNNLIEVNATDFYDVIDDILYKYMILEIDKGNYDYMHGAIGVGLFFLKRKLDTKKRKYIEELIDKIDSISINSDTYRGTRWNYYHKGELIEGSNLGLSHGIPSILSFLVKCYSNDISAKKTKRMIENTVNYIMSVKQDQSVYKSYFPYSLSNDAIPHYTRLAWCYGDISVSCALWQAANAIENENVIKFVLEVLKFSMIRKDLDSNHIYDAALCHGTVGIAHIFNRFYQETQISDFKITSTYWYNETLKMAKFKDGLAGYKRDLSTKGDGLVNCAGFLEGISGIGLGLLASISNIEPNWDECLLIS